MMFNAGEYINRKFAQDIILYSKSEVETLKEFIVSQDLLVTLQVSRINIPIERSYAYSRYQYIYCYKIELMFPDNISEEYKERVERMAYFYPQYGVK